MKEEGIPGIQGIDTRALTKVLERISLLTNIFFHMLLIIYQNLKRENEIANNLQYIHL
jgi:carbamoylphosphate synthase small subunit